MDWQTGPAALVLQHQRKLGGGGAAPGNLPDHSQSWLDQGLFPAAKYPLDQFARGLFHVERSGILAAN